MLRPVLPSPPSFATSRQQPSRREPECPLQPPIGSDDACDDGEHLVAANANANANAPSLVMMTEMKSQSEPPSDVVTRGRGAHWHRPIPACVDARITNAKRRKLLLVLLGANVIVMLAFGASLVVITVRSVPTGDACDWTYPNATVDATVDAFRVTRAYNTIDRWQMAYAMDRDLGETRVVCPFYTGALAYLSPAYDAATSSSSSSSSSHEVETRRGALRAWHWFNVERSGTRTTVRTCNVDAYTLDASESPMLVRDRDDVVVGACRDVDIAHTSFTLTDVNGVDVARVVREPSSSSDAAVSAAWNVERVQVEHVLASPPLIALLLSKWDYGGGGGGHNPVTLTAWSNADTHDTCNRYYFGTTVTVIIAACVHLLLMAGYGVYK